MFKYISDILSKISMKQRLGALAIVLLAIVIISTAPKIVNSFTQDTEELKVKVERQRVQIMELSNQVDTLNDIIISEKRSCTNRFVNREKEIMDMLVNMETEAKKSHNKMVSSTTERMERPRAIIDDNQDPDAPKVSMMMRPSEPTKTTVIITDNSNVLKMLQGMKKNVQEHMGN